MTFAGEVAVEPIGVLFVCLGNICRSPMAEGLMLDRIRSLGVGEGFRVESAGTAAYHTGELADRRTREVLEARGIHLTSRSRQIRTEDFEVFDWILAMDHANVRDLRERCPPAHLHKVRLALEPTTGRAVVDPYYGGADGFSVNEAELDAALDGWLERWLDP